MDVVDLTLSDEENEKRSSNSPSDDNQKQKIMEAVRGINRSIHPNGLKAAKQPLAKQHLSTKRPRASNEQLLDALRISESDEDLPVMKEAKHEHTSSSELEAIDGRVPRAGLQGVSEAAGPSSAINTMLGSLAKEREERMRRAAAGGSSTPSASTSKAVATISHPTSRPGSFSSDVSILTLNVWFKEEVALEARMKGVADLIRQAGYPHILMFQEVTRNIVLIWQQQAWWKMYDSSIPPLPGPGDYITVLCWLKTAVKIDSQPLLIPFPSSVMRRGLRHVQVKVLGHRLVVATSHLESPVRGEMSIAERTDQLRKSITILDAVAHDCDVVFAGDMNWTEQQGGRGAIRDGPMPLSPPWKDIWPELRPKEEGLTWDPRANKMLSSKWKGSRLDSIELVGTQALGGTYINEKNEAKPVYPSDHFGLLLRLEDAGPNSKTPQPCPKTSS
eukprot:gene12577-15801_t